MPDVTCDKDAIISEDGSTLSPGDWVEDTFPPDGVTELEKGVYCIYGDFVMGGGRILNGTEVLFIVMGKVRWNGDATMNLRAADNGDNAGLLLYAPIENKNIFSINGSADTSVKGTILAPGAEIHINGGDSQHGLHSQIIAYRIEADGQSNVVIKYKDEDNWDTYNMPEVQLIQ